MSNEQQKPFDWSKLSHESQAILGDDFWKDFEHIFPKKHPAIDIIETETHGYIFIDLPGIQKPEELSLAIKGQHLLIEGHISRPYKEDETNQLLTERFSGHIHRSVIIPFAIAPNQLKATYTNGVLEVAVPKSTGEYPIRYSVPDK
ncbi:Hsp20/alpha crystallin family protein [Bacillus sp. 1P06AnD]|uniref:Hsp20/alpha crystallin family protein n=1 Tax=Bacillus sp. 1P06AnD TaxID=3132208 RepID=UPI0039A35D59